MDATITEAIEPIIGNTNRLNSLKENSWILGQKIEFTLVKYLLKSKGVSTSYEGGVSGIVISIGDNYITVQAEDGLVYHIEMEDLKAAQSNTPINKFERKELIGSQLNKRGYYATQRNTPVKELEINPKFVYLPFESLNSNLFGKKVVLRNINPSDLTITKNKEPVSIDKDLVLEGEVSEYVKYKDGSRLIQIGAYLVRVKPGAILKGLKIVDAPGTADGDPPEYEYTEKQEIPEPVKES